MAEQQGSEEQTLVETAFGTVTSKRVIYQSSKGWFSGGSRTDIPLQHVTSVRLDISRSVVWGLVVLLIGLTFLAAEGGAKIFGLIALIYAVLLLWGSPAVVVNTAGQDLKAASGFPWHRNEAGKFVEALRKQLFKS
jgi:hypothetical protein